MDGPNDTNNGNGNSNGFFSNLFQSFLRQGYPNSRDPIADLIRDVTGLNYSPSRNSDGNHNSHGNQQLQQSITSNQNTSNSHQSSNSIRDTANSLPHQLPMSQTHRMMQPPSSQATTSQQSPSASNRSNTTHQPDVPISPIAAPHGGYFAFNIASPSVNINITTTAMKQESKNRTKVPNLNLEPKQPPNSFLELDTIENAYDNHPSSPNSSHSLLCQSPVHTESPPHTESKSVDDANDEEEQRRQSFPYFFDTYVKSHISVNRSRLTDLDVMAWYSPQRYPMGDVCYEVTQKEMPVIDWAKSNARTKKYPHRWKCIGVMACPIDDCRFRKRPVVPRYGNGKYSTKGKVPAAKLKHRCVLHPDVDLELIDCDALWFIQKQERVNDLDDQSESTWTVTHKGLHLHPAPESTSATPQAKEKLKEFLRVNHKFTNSELLQGDKFRQPIGEIDPKFMCPDYLTHQRKVQIDKIYNEVREHKLASSSVDTTAEFFRQLRNSNPEVIRKVRMPDKELPFTSISFQTDAMEEMAVNALSSKQVDSIMSASETTFYKDKMYVTITSCWSEVIMGQFPTLVTLHSGMDEKAYKLCHFDIEHESFDRQNVDFEDIDDFYDKIPVVTMDFSLAMANGWLLSLNDLAKRNFGRDARVSKTAQEALQGYCQVHFKANVVKVSKISRVIPDEGCDHFKGLCFSLLKEMEFHQFEAKIKSLCAKYPDAAGWIKWYLNSRIAPHIFPACNSVEESSKLKDRLRNLSKNTNGQEGLGSGVQTWHGGRAKQPNELIESIFTWVVHLTNLHVRAKLGIMS